MYTRRQGSGDANRTPVVGVLHEAWRGCAEHVWRTECEALSESEATHMRSCAPPCGVVHGQRRGEESIPAPLPATP